MTIRLAMIVKDEHEQIAPLAESVAGLIDSWLVVDTGSTDGTQDEVRSVFADLPGALHERPWVSFAHNRTELLRLAEGEGHLLMLDADHRVNVHEPLPDLTADSYLVKIDDSWGGWLPLVTRIGMPFSYEGAAHAYLRCDVVPRQEKLHAISVSGGGGATREKLERDLEALERAFLENPRDPRTVFYLAQTYRDLARIPEAITYYRLRCDLAGFAEERFFARYQLGVLLGEHVSFADGAEELLRAWDERRHRVEPLRALARLADSVADKYPIPDDTLFVMPSAYREVSA